MASAGHLPPLLVRPDGTGEFLDTKPAPPLGVGEFPIESRTFQIEDGSLLVLYTDGLVEDRQRDIDDGLNFLRDVFDGKPARASLDDLCRAALAGAYAHQQRDDIAILIARLKDPGRSSRQLGPTGRTDLGGRGAHPDPRAAAAVGPDRARAHH